MSRYIQDITWCVHHECDKRDCMRHPSHIISREGGFYSFADFSDKGYCRYKVKKNMQLRIEMKDKIEVCYPTMIKLNRDGSDYTVEFDRGEPEIYSVDGKDIKKIIISFE